MTFLGSMVNQNNDVRNTNVMNQQAFIAFWYLFWTDLVKPVVSIWTATAGLNVFPYSNSFNCTCSISGAWSRTLTDTLS